MTNIGITAAGVGIATAVFLAFNLIFDIPSGILADRWSRKGMLIVSALGLGLASIILGSSTGLPLYIIGEVFYGIYIVAMSGTYQALIYDTLHEERRADQYSKIAGKAFALFLLGTAIGNLASGFIVSNFGFRMAFFVSVISCLLNIVVILSIHEPKFHKSEQKEHAFLQLKEVSIRIMKINLVRVLTVVMSILTITELFKSEFGQLYILRYISEPQLIGILWAVYALTWSLGSLIAHRFRTRLNGLVVFTVAPFVIMSFVDSGFSIILFMVQAVASAMLMNQIETRIQEETPSSVRASALSVLSSVGRAISIPASFLIGWIIQTYDVLWAMKFMAVIGIAMLIFWFYSERKLNLQSLES
jgi:MFS family permease